MAAKIEVKEIPWHVLDHGPIEDQLITNEGLAFIFPTAETSPRDTSVNEVVFLIRPVSGNRLLVQIRHNPDDLNPIEYKNKHVADISSAFANAQFFLYNFGYGRLSSIQEIRQVIFPTFVVEVGNQGVSITIPSLSDGLAEEIGKEGILKLFEELQTRITGKDSEFFTV